MNSSLKRAKKNRQADAAVIPLGGLVVHGRPWNVEKAAGRKAMILRLPVRTLAQVRYIAAREDRSQQKVIERILVPAIAHQAEELWITE